MSARKNAIWTEEELETLRELRLKSVPVPKIAEELDRPVSSVYAQARKIGTRVMVRNVWDTEEDEKLKCLVSQGLMDKEIAENLARSVSSVRWRMQMLGLLEGRAKLLAKRLKAGRKPAGDRMDRPAPLKAKAAKSRPRVKTSPKVDIEALRELASTHTRAQAAEALGLSVSQINYAVKDEDLSFLDPRDIAAEKDKAQIRILHEEGLSDMEIAGKISRPRAWVRRVLSELGMISLRKRSKGTEIEIASLREMAKTHTITEAAKALGRDNRTLRKLAEGHGFSFKEATREARPRVKVERKPSARKALMASRHQIRPAAVRRKPPLPPAAMARRLMLIRDIAERMRAEGRLPA